MKEVLLAGEANVHSLSSLMVPSIESLPLVSLKEKPELRQRSQCAPLFSVFDLKQVFDSNNKMYEISSEDAFTWPWLVSQI